jgi:hypothetical protein
MHLKATLIIPSDAPADLGVGVYASDRHGRWFQRVVDGHLKPGTTYTLDVRLDDVSQRFLSEPGRAQWSAASQAVTTQVGIYLWSASAKPLTLTVDGPRLTPEPPLPGTTRARLVGLSLDRPQVHTGERWTLSLRPDPLPANPYDPEEFFLDAVITAPDGKENRIPGFYAEPMRRLDRGDSEIIVPDGAGRFEVRFRPRQPGVHAVRLEARWKGGAAITTTLPPLAVDGPAWDGYVRVDASDPRFFSRGGAFMWPVGPNLRSVNDTRSIERLRTTLTPDRGTFSYDAYLDRLAPQGVTAIEVWMSSWNLALEWRADWPPYHGVGRYSQEHAWALDHLLDAAHRRGISIILVFDNHGKASTRCDTEWQHNPYNRACGGRLDHARELFTEPWARAGQEKLRRYLVARYADHPGLLAWKLFSEISLVNGSIEHLRIWHQQAAQHVRSLDIYDHPVTTHWHHDYTVVDRVIAALPEIDFIAIDAYHGPDSTLAGLLERGLVDPERIRGLAAFGKPVVVTEYGGHNMAGTPRQMEAEHAAGPWIGLVTGYGSSPMLWWFEWIDQGNRFSPYRALTRYLIGEDLRGTDASSSKLQATSADGPLWARAWVRPGRMLGYLLDTPWGQSGGEAAEHRAAQLSLTVKTGAMRLEWWNADTGECLSAVDIQHPGGVLILRPPTFRRHLAFKIWRLPPPSS